VEYGLASCKGGVYETDFDMRIWAKTNTKREKKGALKRPTKRNHVQASAPSKPTEEKMAKIIQKTKTDVLGLRKSSGRGRC